MVRRECLEEGAKRLYPCVLVKTLQVLQMFRASVGQEWPSRPRTGVEADKGVVRYPFTGGTPSGALGVERECVRFLANGELVVTYDRDPTTLPVRKGSCVSRWIGC